MNSHRNYPWKRFCCPKGKIYILDDDGYLPDPEGDLVISPLVRDVYSSLAEKPCTVLLGEPGIGKTQALSDYRTRRGVQIQTGLDPDDLLYLDLRTYSSEARLFRDIFQSSQWSKWLLDGKYTLELILDSLDECMIHVNTVAALLTEEFRNCPVSRLHIRIACRTAEWPMLLNEELPRIWKQENFGTYELLPLRRIDVEKAAQIAEIDTNKFMEAVQNHNMVPFAIKPVTLLMLLQDFKTKGVLGGNQVELYRDYLLHLCREQSRSRLASGAQGQLLPDEKLALAERIAALTVFGKRAAIYQGQDGRDLNPEEDLTVNDLIGGEESAGNRTFEVTPERIEEVLRTTGLFAGGIGARLVWSHWTYAEFLAAMYLIRHEVKPEQADQLLFHPYLINTKSSLVVPQLQETAAWMAANRTSLFEKIIVSDPKALLKSAVVTADSDQRKKLIDSLLRLADAGDITDMEIGLRRRYAFLCHPEIADQLRPYILNKQAGFIARRMAMDIAEICKVEALGDALMDVASDSTENIQNRTEAAYALMKIRSPGLPNLLRQLLEETESDNEDELKGIALRTLWPGDISAEELFEYITPPKRENWYGMYAFFVMNELVPGLKTADLPAALAWVRQQPPDREPSYRLKKLITDIMQLAWDAIDDGEVLSALAYTIVHMLRTDYSLPALQVNANEESLKLADEINKRHQLLEAIATKCVDSIDYSLSHTNLVHSNDLLWLIERLEDCKSESEQRVWATLIGSVLDWERLDNIDAVLSARERNEVLRRETKTLFDAVQLDSPEAERQRKRHARGVRLEQRRKRRAKHPPIPQVVNEWLDKFDEGDINAWWRLTLDMTLESDSDEYPSGAEWGSDLTSLPGWKDIDDATRDRILNAALTYLELGEPRTNEWLGKNILHRPAMAGYKALMLLKRLRSELLNKLPGRLWSKWCPIVLAYPEYQSADFIEPMQQMIALAYSKAPDSFLETIDILINKENQEHGHVFITRKINDLVWDDKLVDMILRKIIRDTDLRPAAISDLLKKPIELNFKTARELAASLVKPNLEDKSSERDKARYCATLLFIYGEEKDWYELKHIINRDVSLGKEVFAEIAQRFRSADRIVGRLSEKSVAELYLWLANEFPQSEDPHHEGAHWVGVRESIANFRDSLLSSLREKGTLNAVEAINHIAESLPELPWIKYIGIEARRVTLWKTWEGQPPHVILELVKNEHGRLIDNGQQLLDAVTVSLQTFQSKLHDETPAVYDLWNENDWTPKPENSISNCIKRHLQADLKDSRIIVNREVEIRKGQESDIHIDAISSDNNIIRMIIEVKGCWHRDLKTAMQTQLRDRYLRENQCEYGLYLVVWFLCSKWRDDEYRKRQTPSWTVQEASTFFTRQAEVLSQPGELLRSFVLDAALR